MNMNPLLSKEPCPAFSQMKPEDIESAISALMVDNRQLIEDMLAEHKNNYTFENLISPLEALETRLQESWGFVKHLNSVRDYPDWRKAYDAMLPQVTEYWVEMGQNEDLYQAMLSIQNSDQYKALNLQQKKVIENHLRDFKLTGVGLDKTQKEQYKSIKKKISEIQNQFSHNVLDATENWFLLILDEARLKGLPQHTIQQAVASATKHQQVGFRLTLDYPCFHAVMASAEDRALREIFYRAYYTLASDQQTPVADSSSKQAWDNGPLLVELLKLKQALSKLLGFQSYADLSLVKKMLKNPKDVLGFLNELLPSVKTKAKQDIELLKMFSEAEYQQKSVEPWDLRFLSEKLLEKNYSFSEEALRAYFPISQVMAGLFQVVHELFDISIQEVKNVDVWDNQVQFFELRDNQNQLLGSFYSDLYARPHKRSGAWCDTCRNRIENPDGSIQYPIAYIAANFRPAADDGTEALLSHEEVITLFHEFGHCLHFILATVNHPSIGPDHGVSWDAIELPSQLMENWCWEEKAIHLFSKHINSGEALSEDLFDKLRRSKNFLIGLHMIRQLEFSIFDFELHMKTDIQDYQDVQMTLNRVRENTAVLPVPAFNRFPNTFSHIFAGGYAAGYYSYLWSEVLSADTYNFFKENNQVFDKAIAKRYREHILEPGGSKEFMGLYLAFRGRPPKVAALLNDWGL